MTRTWSVDEMATLAAAVRDGRPLEDVALELGRTLNAVRIRRNRKFPGPKPDPGVNHGWAPAIGRIEKYWTEERIRDGLRDFVRTHRGALPRSDHEYSRLKKGRLEWPIAANVLGIFGTFPDAWAAVGAPKSRYTRRRVPWTQDEDDYLLGHAGEQTLKVVGARMGRSWAACKRRLYNLDAGGARDVPGYLSAAQVAKEYNCPLTRVRGLIARGELKAHRVKGGRYWRIDPSDVEAIAEKLKQPKRTYTGVHPDVGDYERRYGLRRVRINGRIVRVTG